jgi:DNA polymerase II large subunit
VQSLEGPSDYPYPKRMKDEYDRLYEIASKARAKGFDPSWKVESQTTYDLAERVEKAVGPPGVATRIRELSKLISREETALKISEDIVLGRFGSLASEEAAEQAIRTALAVLDEAVTVAPIQGIHDVKIRTNLDGSKHLAVYFAGPMRSAGGTEMGLTMIVADYVRRQLNIPPYHASEQEALRFVEELRLYERSIARFQYRNPDSVLKDAIMRLTVEPNGVETDPVEVAVNRNLMRIETNRVRGGALRVVNDGLLGRSTKVLKIVEKLGLEGWGWLAMMKTSSSEGEEAKEFMFMEDVVGGRPIFAFPGAPGGFRIRYGRARNTGMASVGVHPATMEVLGGFLAVGVQMRLERPGKAGIVNAVDSIEPPVVKLIDGSVMKIESPLEAKALRDKIQKILFLGDLMVGYGEFLENNQALVPSGFVESWWTQLLEEKLHDPKHSLETQKSLGITIERLEDLAKNPFSTKPRASEAIQLSELLGIPLHPSYTYFWRLVPVHALHYLRDYLIHNLGGSNALPYDEKLKEILEQARIPHKMVEGTIHLREDDATVLRAILRLDSPSTTITGDSSLEALASLAGFPIRDKAPTFVGARMGRPEKAKERIMTPKVHGLFPTGQAGGPRRDLIEASKKSVVSLELVDRSCPRCGRWEAKLLCPNCGRETRMTVTCLKCGQPSHDSTSTCNGSLSAYRSVNVNLVEILEEAANRLRLAKTEGSVKGVKGLINKSRTPEPIEKALLRAKFDVSVFKDGTLRFDASNAVLTQFRPLEIGLSLEKAREIGYTKTMKGEDLTDPKQLCALEIQDLVVSEACGDYLLKVSKFLDELLSSFYGLDRLYKASKKEDLIGHLVVGLSPHTSVGAVGRIVGFSKASVCYAHPLYHAAKRRDCDGDEDSVSLLLDVLLNFSREYLPDRIGGLMDAPLLLAPLINATEVARQAFNIETISTFPLSFYEKTLMGANPKEIEDLVPTLNREKELASGNWNIGFTHPTEDLDRARLTSAYKELPTMLEKVKEQLDLADKIVAVRGEEVARKVLGTHILRDLVGNLRTFTSQRSRCSKCNWKPRRAPLKGVCVKCGGKLGPTVFRAGVEKYLQVAFDMVKRYNVGEYYRQRLDLIKVELDETFKPEEEDRTQTKLLVGEFA